jgi:predicted dehydrogenase/nucleoside-diphosphate-sugar epimerase
MKNENSPRIGIIGCGAAAKRYYLPALKRHEGIIEGLYLVDKNRTQAESLANDLGGGIVHADYREILGKIDGAVILLPHSLHAGVAGEFLNAGIPVLCEKPLAETKADAHALVEAAKRTGMALCVNNTRRMFPSFKEVKRLIAGGAIGTVQSISYQEGATFAWPSATGFYVNPAQTSKGVLLDVGAHVLDLICWWLDTKPRLMQFTDDSFGGPESVAQIKARANGAEIEIFLNRLTDIDSNFRIEGSTGSIVGNVFEWNRLTIKDRQRKNTNQTLRPIVSGYPGFVLPIFDNFLQVIKGSEKPLVSAAEVEPSIELIEECYQNRTHFDLPWNAIPKMDKKPGLVLVTGATGFIGARIVEHLHLSGERRVRAGIHQWSSAARLGRFPVDIALMDLMDPVQIEKGLEGVTHVIHCAKGPGGATEEGTRNLLEAALKKEVARFVHLSTTEVYGEVSGEITEEFPFQYTGNEYSRSKIEAEKACWEYQKKGLPLVVLRPSIVYGPFSNNWTLHFARMLQEGTWGEYEKIGEGTCNLIYVDDLVRAALTVLDHDAVIGEAFHVTGPDLITWNEYFHQFNSALGLPPLAKISAGRAGLKTTLMLPVRSAGKIVKNHFMGPVKKLSEKSVLAKRMLKAVEHKLTTTPVSDELKLFSKKAIFTTSKLKTVTGFLPTTKAEDGIYQTACWLRQLRVIRE